MAPSWPTCMDSGRAVGLLVPETGPMDGIGESVRQGAEVALDAVGREAGIEALVVRDTAGDPETARAATRAHLDDGLPVLAGPVSSDVVLAVRDVVEDAGVPFLPAMGGNPAITRPGTRYTFRFSSSNRQSGLGTLRFFEWTGTTELAVVAADFSYPRAIVEVMRDWAGDHALSLASASFTPLGTEDFTNLVDAIGPDVDGVFLPYPGNNAVTLVRQLRAAGVLERATVLGDYSYGSGPYSARLGEEVVGLRNWGVDTELDRTRALFEAVRERFDRPPGVYHCFGHDVVGLAAAAAASAGDWEPEALRDALAGVSYDSVSGWGVAFDEHGRNDRYAMVVGEWVAGEAGPENRPVFRSEPLAPPRD